MPDRSKRMRPCNPGGTFILRCSECWKGWKELRFYWCGSRVRESCNLLSRSINLPRINDKIDHEFKKQQAWRVLITGPPPQTATGPDFSTNRRGAAEPLPAALAEGRGLHQGWGHAEWVEATTQWLLDQTSQQETLFRWKVSWEFDAKLAVYRSFSEAFDPLLGNQRKTCAQRDFWSLCCWNSLTHQEIPAASAVLDQEGSAACCNKDFTPFDVGNSANQAGFIDNILRPMLEKLSGQKMVTGSWKKEGCHLMKPGTGGRTAGSGLVCTLYMSGTSPKQRVYIQLWGHPTKPRSWCTSTLASVSMVKVPAWCITWTAGLSSTVRVVASSSCWSKVPPRH